MGNPLGAEISWSFGIFFFGIAGGLTVQGFTTGTYLAVNNFLVLIPFFVMGVIGVFLYVFYKHR